MIRIEAEARERLLQRRRILSRTVEPGYESGPAACCEKQTPPESVRHEMDEIDSALARIDEGRYGRCLRCGGPIGLQRLRAIPEARYCMSCSGQAMAVD